ncbi:MAG: hypothetical protein K8R60_18525 [Burkholderiales bacterium]|nr:hypothetical protein [Burkholderiales bacterium]
MSGDASKEPGVPSAGPEHDAWLREALRHAPDAGAAPPPTLRDAILAEARAAARTAAAPRIAATPSLVDRVLEFWSWLARPQVAAGFASVMAATLVGMLWWDRPIEETMLPPPASPPVATAPAEAAKQAAANNDRLQPATAPPAAPTAAPPVPRDATPSPAKSARPPAAQEADATTAPRAERQQRAREGASDKANAQADAKARIAIEDERAEQKERAGKPDAPQAPSTPAEKAAPPATSPPPAAAPVTPAAPTPFPARAPSDDNATSQRSAPVAAPRPAPPAPPAPPTPQPGAAAGRAEPFALQKKAESGEKDGAAAATRSTPPAPAPRAPAPLGALGRSSLDSAEASAQRPMAPLLAALAGEDARWSRPLAGGGSIAVDSGVRTWLAQVQSAAPRWEAAGDRTGRRDALAASSSPPATLLLERDGRSGAIVRIEDGGVLFDPVTGPAWFAPLPAEVVARLRATLPPARR